MCKPCTHLPKTYAVENNPTLFVLWTWFNIAFFFSLTHKSKNNSLISSKTQIYLIMLHTTCTSTENKSLIFKVHIFWERKKLILLLQPSTLGLQCFLYQLLSVSITCYSGSRIGKIKQNNLWTEHIFLPKSDHHFKYVRVESFSKCISLCYKKFKTTSLNIIVQFQLSGGVDRKEDGSLFALRPHWKSAGFYFLMKKISANEKLKNIIECGILELFTAGETRKDLLLLQRSFLDEPFYSKERSNLSTSWMINSLLVKSFIYHKQWKKYRKKNQ